MNKRIAAAVLAAVGCIGHALAAADAVDIPYTRHVLPNGLTLIVHEDHKAPVVAVSIWYHVGSADEPAGKTGFAHLFEHLMFSGSENHKGTWFGPFEKVGATDQNGTTWFDRTNYFQTVPTTALDMTLWLESDRMGHLLGAIGQHELDTQRGVVQNEKRQGENRPYGRVEENILANTFPANHPYQHDTIGSMADLDAASLDDVKQWFHDYYGAANTTIVLAGDVTPAVALDKVTRYFGDIPAGPPVPRQQPWVAQRTTSTRGEQVDHVAQVRIHRVWNVAELGHADQPLLTLAAAALGGSKTSRLYERLVYKDKLVDDVSVEVAPFALVSQFMLSADVRSGVDPARVEKAIAEEWKKFLAEGPTDDELARAKMASRAGFIRGLEKVGGFSGKATVLAEAQVYRGSPDAWKIDYQRLQAATPASVKAAAKRWIAKGDYTLVVRPPKEGEAIDEAPPKALGPAKGKPAPKLPPKREYATVKSNVDRSAGVPAVTTFPALSFPAVERGRLANGIEVVLARRDTIPVVQIQLQFAAGYASDVGRPLGTSSFAMAMLDEGTQALDSLEIARRSQRLGARINSGSGLDASSVSLNALKAELEPSLALFADIVRNPAFREADIERVRGQWLAGIAQEKTEAGALALRALPPLLYGEGHPYAIPFTGSGTEASIGAIDAAELKRFHSELIRPDNVRVLVAGDIELDEIVAALDRHFGRWPATRIALPPKRAIPAVAAQKQARVFLIDRPAAPQTLIFAGALAPSTTAANNIELATMNAVFGGTFTSRLNMNLREDKRWAYGARSSMSDALGQRPFIASVSVQTDKTAESITEILRESRAIVGERPPSADEITKIREQRVRALPGSYETTAAVLGTLSSNALYGRPDDYATTLKARYEGLKDADIEAAAREVIRADTYTWVVVGDLAKIEEPVRALGLGEVKVLDADGKVVR
ncbi:pitrilysin family protein [Dokdonella sp.]|uniref:M16 family metallopeptidase n=1 Tax=Dokdonella sp. TaxID=2291710 RepID=UPI0031B889C8|nr:insulinase family protein [Dokdonella sp.]MCW5566733.1 insulinase family protein [Dokdonella sp.]